MVGIYLTTLILVALFVYAGYENTMRLFNYADLELRYFVIRVKMWMMRRKLEKQLNLPTSNFKAQFKDLTDD